MRVQKTCENFGKKTVQKWGKGEIYSLKMEIKIMKMSNGMVKDKKKKSIFFWKMVWSKIQIMGIQKK